MYLERAHPAFLTTLVVLVYLLSANFGLGFANNPPCTSKFTVHVDNEGEMFGRLFVALSAGINNKCC